MLAGLLSACSPSGGDERTEPLTKDVSPQSYTETKDGVTLRVTVQNPVCRPGDTVEVEAVVTNASGKEIQYYLPTTTNNMHFEITVEIKKNDFSFVDLDVYQKPMNAEEGHGSLAPGASGRYAGTAVFRWDNQENLKDGKSVAVAFPITVQAD